jgi:hypothetical protein
MFDFTYFVTTRDEEFTIRGNTVVRDTTTEKFVGVNMLSDLRVLQPIRFTHDGVEFVSAPITRIEGRQA